MTRSLDRMYKKMGGSAITSTPTATKKTTKAAPAVKAASSSASALKPGKRTIKLGIDRDSTFMYFIKDGAVWRVPRKRPGMPKGKKEKIRQFAEAGSLDYGSYLYYLDGAGNVVMNPRKNRRV